MKEYKTQREWFVDLFLFRHPTLKFAIWEIFIGVAIIAFLVLISTFIF
jgi:hypothetical protein